MAPKPKPAGMKLAMPEYTPELEYTLNLGAEISRSTTPLPSDSESTTNADVKPKPPSPSPVRTRSWRPEGVEREQKARSTAYDAAGNLKIAVRGRKAAANDCGICEEVAVEPVKTQCCGALFCRQHIDEWIYAPTADGRCPACKAPCVLPPSRPLSPASSPSQYPLPASNTPTPAERKDILGSTTSLRRSGTRTPPPSPLLSSPSSPLRASAVSPGVDVASVSSRKYTRPGMDALVRLLSGIAALLLLLGALSRRGGGGEVTTEL
ncbi:hypothetical protein C8R45DRAFT_1212922 [Mycena sanguinolenta]|nr:hypothetical protein C8R45DRAFT_1212922 [Mycena sanguinolenta]